ncbi:MAG: MaoC/PaaZ C-terminal domain-containing protein [Candidatus Thorarchaeota archaeon]|jgi:acyl dehydratase
MVITERARNLNPKYIGREYRSGPHLIESMGIRQYALATNETNPLYVGGEATEGLVAPPLYPVVFFPSLFRQFFDDAEKIGLDRSRVVHAEHEMSWKDVLRSGDRIHLIGKIVNMERRGTNELLDMQIDCMREDEVLIEILYRRIVRGKKKPSKKKTGKKQKALTNPNKLASRTIIVTDDQAARYAEASGDHNPIHLDSEFAISVGLPGVILHGLCTLAFASQTIVDELLGGDPSGLGYMKTRFSKPVALDQSLSTVVYDSGTRNGEYHILHFETKDSYGVPVLTHGVSKIRRTPGTT